MAENKKIGILYSYNENWIGGTYYIHNLIKAFSYLNDSKQPFLKIIAFDKKDFEHLQKVTGYQKMEFASMRPTYNLAQRILNKAWRTMLKKNLIDKRKNIADLVFPVMQEYDELFGIKAMYWIPDFQEAHLPHFFSNEEISERQNWQKKIANKKKAPLILSSEDALNNFKNLYPNALTQNFVLPFSCINKPIEKITIEQLRIKFKINTQYLIAPNQFWVHKNHQVCIKAIEILKNQGIEAQLVFTGKEYDYRSPQYTENLKKMVVDANLEAQILFLGFIDRNEQLILIKNSVAVIQPSRYEGWSTVVEDAKSLNKTIIASDLAVHYEQLKENGNYFSPEDPNALAHLIKDGLANKLISYNTDYEKEIRAFAINFLNITAQILSE